MSYADTENEHHEAISTGIVALRNEVAKLTASAHNMRGQGLACDDADRARALYESAAAYADAAYRVGNIVNDFEQAESFRAGAMEAIGPVPTYDELERRLGAADKLEKVARGRAQFLENLISGLDADLGGAPRTTTEDVLAAAARAAHDARRFEGIRNAAVNLLDKVGAQYSAHTLVDLLTILLDGDSPDTLAKFRAATGVDKPVKAPLFPPELGEQIQRVVHKITGYEPSLGEVVSGFETADVDGERTVGKITFIDARFVTVELARYRESTGWYLGYSSLDRTELRPANSHEITSWQRNLQLLQQENPAALKDSALLLEPGHLAAEVPDDEAAQQWVPKSGQIVVALDGDGKRAPVQFVALDTQHPEQAIIQLPGKLETADGVEYVWESRRIDLADLRAALPHEMNEFTAQLEAKGLDQVIR